tara:strand:+ start:312 stop:1451 length:1140 start_codon:yes stop_codon:yes gene_type:complete
MNKKLFTFFFIFLFILPEAIVNFIPLSFRDNYYYSLFLLLGIYFLFNHKLLLRKDNSFLFYFILISISFGVFNAFIKQEIHLFRILLPFYTYLSYKIIIQRKLNLVVFDYSIIVLYFVFYSLFFVFISDLTNFQRSDDNDVTKFSEASSNLIASVLNNFLLAYSLLNYIYKAKRIKTIFIFSIINLILILIQQSRIGIFVAVILLIITLYQMNSNLFIKYRSIIFLFFVSAILLTLNWIFKINIASLDNILNELLLDGRLQAQYSFFKNLNFQSFLFGYSDEAIFFMFSYTYNVFLDFWSNYGLIPFLILMFLIIYRFSNNNKFLLPSYYLIPFLFYSMFESIYFPNFWDVFIYLILFTKTNSPISNLSEYSSNKINQL